MSYSPSKHQVVSFTVSLTDKNKTQTPSSTKVRDDILHSVLCFETMMMMILIVSGPLGQLEEMHLLPDPIFVLPTDGVAINTIASTSSGRIFLGGRDGCLYEVAYEV
jgi:uncharacterized membrane protein (DUF4010 family)